MASATIQYNSEVLPRTEINDFYDPPEDWGCVLEFRLVYRGYLPPATRTKNRPQDKHRLRKVFHRQLAELWKQHPLLRPQLTEPVIKFVTPQNMVSEPGPGVTQIMRSTDKTAKPWVEHLADNNDKFGYRFVPLVQEDHAVCSVDILLLRRDSPGGLLRNAGDIDNRIKVIVDALKVPKDRSELGGFSPDADETPFFCVLENDASVTSLKVTSDRLLCPLEPAEQIEHVYALLHVKTHSINPEALFADVHS